MSCTRGPLAQRVVVLPAGEEVRRRQPLLRETRAVGAAADDRVHRLDACTPDRLLGDGDDLGVPVEHLPHVAVLLLDLERERRARLARRRSRSPAAGRPRRAPRAGRRRGRATMNHTVASDVPPARRIGWTNPSRSSVVSGESPSRGSDATTSATSLTALTSRPFADAGMDADALDRELELVRRERLHLDLAEARAVERVREVGAERRRDRSGPCPCRPPRRP